VLWACDVVFGATTMVVGLLATALWIAGAARTVTVVLLWSVPAFNLPWTAAGVAHEINTRRDRRCA